MSHTKVNLACGGDDVTGDGWLNLDYVSSSRNVRRADLLGRLPLADHSAELIYSSHFLEHIPRDQVKLFLRECWRILRPGGVLRLVVPDLENLCRTYLVHRDRAEHEKADFVVMELLDQCVRHESGGALGRYYQSLRAAPQDHPEPIAFVRERTGEDLLHAPPPRRVRLETVWTYASSLAESIWIRAVLQLLPRAFREQNVSLASVGERHHWLYDAHQLQQLLATAGFEAIERCDATSSRCVDFPFHPLDLDDDRRPRKGAESLYIEALKPNSPHAYAKPTH